jgi:putative oxidoreductase
MNKLLLKLANTDKDYAAMVARVFLGIVMLPHGMQKTLGAFGGHGFSATLAGMESMGMPAPVAFLVIMAESLGALALVLGLFGRFMAFGIFAVMTGAIFMAHIHVGFFMNWYGAQSGEGFEYHLLAIGLALVVMIKGSGAFSIDKIIGKK